MNITKQIFKKSVLVGTIALSIAVFAGCSDSSNSSTADTTKPTEAQTTVQATEGTAKSGTTNESFDLKSLHTCKENDEDDLVGTWQITSGEGSQYASFYYMFNGEGKSIRIQRRFQRSRKQTISTLFPPPTKTHQLMISL